MKILIITKNFWPERFLVNDIAEELAKKHDVTVLCGTPNYFYEGKQVSKTELENKYPSINFLVAKTTNRKKGLLNYLKNSFSFVKNSKRILKKHACNYDVIYSYQLSPISISAPAVWLKKRTGIKLFIYCLDIWPESAKAKFGKFKIFYSFIKRYSKKIYSFADTIAVTSKSFIEYLSEINKVSKDNLYYLPQHGDNNLLYEELAKESSSNTIHFLYAGNIGNAQKIDVLIKAISLMKDRNVVFDIVGTGSCVEECKKLALSLSVSDRVLFHGQKTKEDVKTFYHNADALLLALRGDNKVGLTLPGKVQTYMSCGKPIFASAFGDTERIINESRCGCCVSPDSPEKLADVLDDFVMNPRKYETCGKNAIAYYLDNFTLEKHMLTLNSLLQSLLENNND